MRRSCRHVPGDQDRGGVLPRAALDATTVALDLCSFPTTSTETRMDDRPDEKALSAAANFSILDSSGNRVNFGDIYKEKKTIVVFIRKYFSWHNHVGRAELQTNV